ncbi:MAG: cation transporter [Candidatus Micrarchaeota archaeon]|nr:cation transporter [Candidatus Micrarchaeota archaeon]
MKRTLYIEGMHCASCEKLIAMNLLKIAGVKAVKADAQKGIVEIEGEGYDLAVVRKAVQAAGYKVKR